jgi:hypothetical protein
MTSSPSSAFPTAGKNPGATTPTLTEHLKAFATGDVGPAGTASESQHEILWRALVGGPAPVPLREGVHAQLARAFGHDGRVLQEHEDKTPALDDWHARLARALRT